MIDARTVADALRGQVLDGRYRLKGLVGAGGFGLVMTADQVLRDEVLAEVAVKLVSMREDRLRHQIDELRRGLSLSHDGLVRALGIGEGTLRIGDASQAFVYLAMELGEETLEARLERRLMGADEAVALTTQMAQALAYLRSQRVLHRDLKPSNVLCFKGRWKLADLGIARTLDDGLTQDGAAPGTLYYMPPEALDGVQSPSWDVWSLGVMVMEALTNQLPYPRESLGEWRRMLRTREPEIPFGLPEPLGEVIRGCLQRDRSRRLTPEGILEHLRSADIQPQPGPAVIELEPGTSGGHKLSEAVRAAQPWTRILLRPGVYSCHLAITQPIELIGVGAAADVIIEGGARPALTLSASEGIVRGISLRTSADAAVGRAVVEVLSGGTTIELCDIASQSLDCLVVIGREARPIVRRTRLIGGRHHGAAFMADAEGVLDSCPIMRSPRAAISIADRANPLFRRVTVRSPGFRAVSIAENGRGVLEDCTFEGGSGPVIELFSRSEAAFRRCRLLPGSDVGVRAHSGAKAVFQACEIDAPAARRWSLASGHQVRKL